MVQVHRDAAIELTILLVHEDGKRSIVAVFLLLENVLKVTMTPDERFSLIRKLTANPPGSVVNNSSVGKPETTSRTS